MKKVWLLIGVLVGFCVIADCSESRSDSQEPVASVSISDEEMADIISRGDVVRNQPPKKDQRLVPLYQGNGRFGTIFGPFGLHVNPNAPDQYGLPGEMRFWHIKHYVRAKFGADYLLPVATIYWETEPKKIKQYRQRQSFYDGTINTHFETADCQADITSWFDPLRRDVAGFVIDAEGNCPSIIVDVFRDFKIHYGDRLKPSISDTLSGHKWQVRISCNNAKSSLTVKSTAMISRADGGGIRLELKPGRNEILIAVNSDIDISAEKSLDESIKWWHSKWAATGWLDLPDEAAHKVWVRSMAYALYSHNDDDLCCSPPCGLTGIGWPFSFPFDSSFRHMLLLSTGQLDTAKKWIEHFHSHIDGMKKYTKRLMKKDGIMLPHVFPYGPFEGFHDPVVPNKYYYPIYNTGHLVRMADQTAVVLGDPKWTDKYVKPLVEQAVLYYLDCLEKGDDGQWHLYAYPSLGLDEWGLVNQRDYVDGLVSARYVLEKAVEYGVDNAGKAEAILRDGLAFKSLLSPKGMYYSYAGRPNFRQKHPAQIHSLVGIPLLCSEPDAPTRKAHELRYELSAGAGKSFAGHTGGEIIMSSARMHNADEWRRDWANFQPSNYADPDWIQFYESSGRMPMYVTTQSLVAQAILETIVSSWWGRLDLAPSVPWQGKLRFGNIYTQMGVVVSGEFDNGKGKATLRAYKDTRFKYRDRTINLKKGEQITVNVN
jgi:hypothetical protein